MSFSSSTGSHLFLETASRYSRSPSGHTPLSASPRPGSSLFTRPQWPWTGHRSSSSSQAYIAPVPIPAASRPLATGSDESQWSGQTAHNQPVNMPEDTSVRQWSFSAFEWTIKHVAALRDHVEITSGIQTSEGSNASEDGVDEDGIPLVLKQSPMIGENGENKFKVEIARISSSEEPSSTPTGSPTPSRSNLATLANGVRVPNLSLYITSLFLDFAHPEFEFCSAIMVAIKCREDRAGDRGARSDWVWEFWDNEFVFRKGSEFWECQLPTLTSLLEHPRIAAQDSFVLCIQIHSPIGFYPQFPHAYYVPRDLLQGLEASLDNPSTGDVRFITLQWLESEDSEDLSPPLRSPPPSAEITRSSSAVGMARQRTLYAHSDILKRRSEYFATMLDSAFAESNPATYPNHGESQHPARKVHDIVVSEADFITIYWLLKWIYADWISFKDVDDARLVMSRLGGGWSVHSLAPTNVLGGSEWDWRTVLSTRRRSTGDPRSGSGSDTVEAREREEDEQSHARSVRSVSSSGTNAEVAVPGPPSKAKAPSYPSHVGTSSTRGARGGRASVATVTGRGGASTSLAPAGGRRAATGPSPTPGKPPNISVPSDPEGGTAQAGPSRAITGAEGTAYGGAPRNSVSPHRTRYPPGIHTNVPNPMVEPHAHPTPQLPPASALAVYQIAHRYSLPGLQLLALEHMMNTITPTTAFPLLLATHLWEDLHGLIEDFIVEHFDAVSRCEVFDNCCEEVALGEWGPAGGRTLAALFKRLAAPQTLRYNRT